MEIEISGMLHRGRAVVPLYVRFPVMESLQYIMIIAPPLELNGNDYNLSSVLPGNIVIAKYLTYCAPLCFCSSFNISNNSN